MSGKLSAHSSRSIIGMFYNKLNAISAMSWAFMVAHYNPNSDQTSEEYLQTSETPQFQPWVGMRDVKGLDEYSITVPNVKYQAALREQGDFFRYDKTGQLMDRIGGFAKRSVTFWGKLATQAIQLGTSSLGTDGEIFFSADHYDGQRNILTANEESELAVVNPLKPTSVEMADAFGTVITYMQGYVDTQDEPLSEDATSFHIMVPQNMSWAAQQAISKAVISDSSGAKDNPLIGSNFNITVSVNPRLPRNAEFYVFRTDGDTKALMLQERGGLKLSAKAEGSEYEHDTDMWEFGAKTVRGVGLYNWENAAKATLSAIE
ncbi:MAG: Mu-like prophage major head subunit gpT family protein [Fuerstiella sp.]